MFALPLVTFLYATSANCCHSFVRFSLQFCLIVYNDQPTITAVWGRRLVTGVIELTVEGRGFGFEKDKVSVTAYNYFDDDDTVRVE